MQWFGRKQEEDPREFWRRTAEQRGGEIGFLSFATLLGRSSDQPLELPGLLYTVGEQAWFEDFERDNWLFKIMVGRKKFEKTEISFGRAEIRSTQLVSRSGAMRCVAGTIAPEKLPSVSLVGKFFSTPVVQIAMTNGTSLFFDMIRRDDFLALVRGGQWPKAGTPPATGAVGVPPTP